MIYIAPFFVCLFAFYWLKSERWKDILSPNVSTTGREMFPAIMVGYAGTAVLPLQMGEILRTLAGARKTKLPFTLILSSIVIERIFDLLTILFLLGIVLALGQATPAGLVSAGYVISAVTAVGLLIGMLLVLRREATLSFVRRLLTFVPKTFSDGVISQLENAADGLKSIASPYLMLRVSTNSLVQWTIMGACIWCSLLAFDIQVPPTGVALVLVATIVGISVPSSPGHVGNVQLAFVVALEPFGISPSSAIAVSIFYHLLAYATVVVVGLYFAHRIGIDVLAARQSSNTQRN